MDILMARQWHAIGCNDFDMTEIEILKKMLAEAKAENQSLRLQLDNVTLLLRKEMVVAGKPPKYQNAAHNSKLELSHDKPQDVPPPSRANMTYHMQDRP